jgi:TPR repeat protein
MTLSHVKNFLLLMSVLVFLASCQTHQDSDTSIHSRYLMPVHAFDDTFSSNWVAAVRAALPPRVFAKKNLDFQTVTNLLCRESRHGNTAAQGLWGFTLVILSRSPAGAETGLQLLRNAAEKGDVPAMLQLASLYEGGKYVRRNYNETFHWYGMAADKGNAEAELELGGCYHYGFGTTPDFVKAAECYRRSAGQTNYVAMKSLGYLLMNGYGVDKDLGAARYWLTRAAKEGGNRRAMYNLGGLCTMNYPDTNSMVEAFQWYKQSAGLGDPLACFQLANFYYRGWGAVETNIASYHYWRLKAAILGATEAQYDLGVAYRLGDGVIKDTTTSLVWYQRAAAKNHPKAFYDLALHYIESRTNRASLLMANDYILLAAQAGHREAQLYYAMSCFRSDIAPINFEDGKYWLARSAEAGWNRAEFYLFQLYFNGIAPGPECPPYPKDVPEAMKWIHRAADHGNLQAQSTLAVMMIRGIDVETNKVEAEKLLRNAAEHGFSPAQNDLGFAIENGDLTSTNIVESAMWCELAMSPLADTNTMRRAKVNFSNALSRLTSVDDLLEVDERVKNFQALPAAEIDPMPEGWEQNDSSYQQEDGRFGH